MAFDDPCFGPTYGGPCDFWTQTSWPFPAWRRINLVIGEQWGPGSNSHVAKYLFVWLAEVQTSKLNFAGSHFSNITFSILLFEFDIYIYFSFQTSLRVCLFCFIFRHPKKDGWTNAPSIRRHVFQISYLGPQDLPDFSWVNPHLAIMKQHMDTNIWVINLANNKNI